jgi:heme-degrading monooxygenase HmoA
MVAIMWQFDVKPGLEAEFEAMYGAGGDWTRINRETRSYLGTSFLRDQNTASRYILIEYWSEMVVYEKHRRSHAGRIATFEAHRSSILQRAEPLGVFTALDTPERTGPAWSTAKK